LFFLSNTDIIVLLLQGFVCCITHALNNAQLTRPVTSGVHHSKHAYVLKADILNTYCKLICVDKQRNSIPDEYVL